MRRKLTFLSLAAATLSFWAASGARADHNMTMMGVVDGVSGTLTPAPVEGDPAVRRFSLRTGTAHISTPDGNSVLVWGFADGVDPATGDPIQYPGPTLIANEGEIVEVEVTNGLSVATSIVFPGQEGVVATEVTAPSADGLLTREAGPPAGGAPGGTVRYSFLASHPGTYLYQSGTSTDLQVEMGLVGALIIRPAHAMPGMGMGGRAYHQADSSYDVEYLFLATELDLRVHRLVEQGRMAEVDTTEFFPVNWFFNGRCAPDTMFEAFVAWLPSQPYNCMPMMEVGQKMLMRVIGGGRDLHPFHFHGNHARVIARDGRVLSTSPMDHMAPIDLGQEVFTIQVVPGQTVDAIWTWTGEGLGWDIYGHAETDPMAPGEYAPDHGKPFPVLLPDNLDLAFGGMWSGSPFLGGMDGLPPGEGGLNPLGAFTYMWHSHTEKEMCNNDIFPGGMMTMSMVLAPGSGMMPMALTPGDSPLMGGR